MWDPSLGTPDLVNKFHLPAQETLDEIQHTIVDTVILEALLWTLNL